MMKKTRTQWLRTIYAASDYITTSFALFAFNVVRYYLLPSAASFTIRSFLESRVVLLEQIFVPIGLMAVYALSGYYNRPFERSRLHEFLVTVTTAVFNSAVIFLIFLINDPAPKRRTEYLLIFLLFALLLTFTYLGRLLVTQSVLRRRRRQPPAPTVIVGNSKAARKMQQRLERRGGIRTYEVTCFVRIPGEKDADSRNDVIGLDELSDYCRSHDVDQIVVVPEHHVEQTVLGLLDRLFPLGIPVRIAPGILSYVTASIRVDDIMAQPLIDLTSPRIGDFAVNLKRVWDVGFSLISLFLLSPMLAAVAIAVKLDSPGPVFYSQKRIGRRQKPFDIYKFRTMAVDAEASGPQLSHDNDPRVTRVGRFLRKYRIDEVPQFWNVIKGDMSIVGPRPEREYYIRRIVRRAPYYSLVYQVRPGITSWGMVKYGYASTLKEMVGRTKYDLMYITNMSVALDMKIMLFTVQTVLAGRGK